MHNKDHPRPTPQHYHHLSLDQLLHSYLPTPLRRSLQTKKTHKQK